MTNQLNNSLKGATGSGAFVGINSATLVTPNIGTPASATLTNCSGLLVSGGGTGKNSFTAFGVVCGGTTSTAALQNVSGLGTSGQVLTSNGAGNLPTWQNAFSSFTTQTDQTAFRVIGNVYQNTSGKTMFVSVTIYSATSTLNISALTDSSNPPSTVVCESQPSDDFFDPTYSFMVLNNNYYQVNGLGGGSILQWIEWT